MTDLYVSQKRELEKGIWAIIAIAVIICIPPVIYNTYFAKPEVIEKPTVVMSAANEVCFQVSADLAEATKEQGKDPFYYHSEDCGTDAQREAFKSGDYVVAK